MKVLLISQYVPPVNYIGTIRMTEIANQFAKNGFEVVIFASDNYKYNPTNHFYLDPRIQVKRTSLWDALIIREKLRQSVKKVSNQKEMISSPKMPSFNQSGFAHFRIRLFDLLTNYL